MCRWLAYIGSPIHLDTLILRPENSLISQSRAARRGVSTTNGDGFGIGWYDASPEPGVFRDVLPAWNDENLRSVSEQIRARLFFAHVRASTGTPTVRTNCHPFRHERWLFMHNGQIGDFERLRHELTVSIAPRYFNTLLGSTDSEVFFHLMLTHGLETDSPGAFRRAVAQVLAVMANGKAREPFRMTAAVTNGEHVLAVRASSDHRAPSLYYGRGVTVDAAGHLGVDPHGESVLILSEPLNRRHEEWIEIPEEHLLHASRGRVEIEPLHHDA
ncbi:MAG: class II glutamine amidotransferase [Alphaproteobacteria bacterium]|nr:class II glutamine amidotransferase [Alphaproteobacteria bacterium]